ncbi:MAG: riboflavin synthase [Lentisphaeria bacterium]|nr:riboflavin synthase [Lentisphaeria bacterium]
MFTGIIEKQAELVSRKVMGKAGKLVVEIADGYDSFSDLVIGESIAVNGCCLSLEKYSASLRTLEFHTLAETLDKTNLGSINKGGKLNLERALTLNSRLGGHFVSGHIDGTSEVISLKKQGDDYELKIAMQEELLPYMVPKGSIAINGVSLTLVEVNDKFFTVHLIPLTLGDTNIGSFKGGELVNLETDLIGKYVAFQLKSLMPQKKKSNITMDTLAQAGFF